MNSNRILDAVWSTCLELRDRDSSAILAPRTANGVLREAAGCVLASRVTHEMATAAVNRLEVERLLPTLGCELNKERLEAALRAPLSATYPRAYRFPSQGAARIHRLAGRAELVVRNTLQAKDVERARSALVAVRCGLGLKQASLLLRSLHPTAELAVLDVHLLAFMRIVGLTSELTVPVKLKEYVVLEDRFRNFAQGLGVPLRRLDIAAWIVMRAVRVKGAGWQS